MVDASDPAHHKAIEPYFDAAFYLATYSDIRDAGIDPLEHFLLHGWREGRNPSTTFDVGYYLGVNTDVAAAGINPLLHYAFEGATEGRLPRRPLHATRRHLAATQAPRDRAVHWLDAADRSEAIVLSAAMIRGAAPRGLVVSVSHDDYALNYGGVQNLIVDEQSAFAGAGWSYLHVSPAAPLPMLADPQTAEGFRVRLRRDDTALGVARFADLVSVVAELAGQSADVQIIVHHMMGHVPELLAQLAGAARSRPILWVHDFFTLCPSYSLMRNDVKFCGAPQPHSGACGICSFGSDRLAQSPRMRAFFDVTRPFVLAPSEPTLAFWRLHAELSHAGSAVQPPARLLMDDADRELAVPPYGRHARLRVAHLGARAFHKGWAVFEDLALGFVNDDRYSFWQLGINHSAVPAANIRDVPVWVTAADREAMIEAVAEHRIDVVVNWSLWPETFCFVVHEALAGGAFVVTHAGAGNVAPALRLNAPWQGCVVDDEVALARLFRSGEIRRLVAQSHRRRGALLTGGGTADWLMRQRPDAALTQVAANG